MAESSILAYGAVIILGIFFGYLLLSLRFNRLNQTFARQKFRITYGFIYGLIGLSLLTIGFYFAYFGLLSMMFTDISITYFNIPTPDLSSVDSENMWLVNSTFAILEGVKKQSIELKHSEGLALTGIGFGIILVSIPMLLESWRHGSETRKTITFVIADFEEINSKLVTVVNLLQNTMNDILGNGNFIRNMIQENVHPVIAFGTIVSGLYFNRWELYASHLREFGLTDPKIINQLHGFILEFNRNVEPTENSMVRNVMNILNSGDPDIFQQLQTFLIPELTRNLNNYRNLYNTIHRELDEIPWIPNRSWRQL